MPARGESVVVHARWYKAMNVPESSGPPLCPGSPRHGSVSVHRATARGRRCLGVDRGTLRGRRCVSHHFEVCRCVATAELPDGVGQVHASARAHSPIARPRSDSRPPWQASCRRRACGSRETGSRVAANLEVRPEGERRMGSSGVNGFIRQDKVLLRPSGNALALRTNLRRTRNGTCTALSCRRSSASHPLTRPEETCQ